MAKRNNSLTTNKTYLAIGGLAALALILLNSEYGLSNKMKEAFKEDDRAAQATPTPSPDSSFPGEFSMNFDEKARVLTTTQITHAEDPNRKIKFSISVLPGWEIERAVQTDQTFRFELKNGEYSVMATYGFPEEGANCYFPGDNVPEPRTGYQLVLEDFVSVETDLGTLRIARRLENYTSYEGETFSVCKLNQYNEWSPSIFLLSAPQDYDQLKIDEMVVMIKSVQLR